MELDPGLAGCNDGHRYKAALVLLSALHVSGDPVLLAQFTRLPLGYISEIHRRMILAELWSEEDVCCEHWFASQQKFRAAAFWLDVLVAQGLVLRRWFEEEGQYRYRAEDSEPTQRMVLN